MNATQWMLTPVRFNETESSPAVCRIDAMRVHSRERCELLVTVEHGPSGDSVLRHVASTSGRTAPKWTAMPPREAGAYWIRLPSDEPGVAVWRPEADLQGQTPASGVIWYDGKPWQIEQLGAVEWWPLAIEEPPR